MKNRSISAASGNARLRHRTPSATPWRRVVFSSDCDEDGNCPRCGIDYADCPCPGPTQDEEYDYREIRGVLYAKAKSDILS